MRFSEIEPPTNILHSNDLLCKFHLEDIDRYYNSIISACITVASSCIPKTSKPRLAGWNDHVKMYKEQSVFWHRIWIDNCYPR